jgi:hypothetical protein
LIEQKGQLATRKEIAEKIWGNELFVDTENSINGAIRKIRQVLKDDPHEPRYVQTLSGRGCDSLRLSRMRNCRHPRWPGLESRRMPAPQLRDLPVAAQW